MSNEPPKDPAPSIPGDALRAFVAELRAIAEDERSVGDRRHVAEHAIAALVRLLTTPGAPAIPAVVVDALTALIAALDAIDHGNTHALLRPAKSPPGRPRTALDARIVLGSLAHAIEYVKTKDTGSRNDAARTLVRELARHGLKVKWSRLLDLLDRESRLARTQGFAAARPPLNDDEYGRLIVYLADHLPALL